MPYLRTEWTVSACMDTFLINKDALLWPEGVGEVDKSWEDFREGVRSWEFFLNMLPSVNERPLLNCGCVAQLHSVFYWHGCLTYPGQKSKMGKTTYGSIRFCFCFWYNAYPDLFVLQSSQRGPKLNQLDILLRIIYMKQPSYRSLLQILQLVKPNLI